MKTKNKLTASAGRMPRLVRLLRVATGWMILLAVPLGLLAIWFSEGLVKGLIQLVVCLCFGVIATSYLALGLWLIHGGKSS
jgi:hypothetical protein